MIGVGNVDALELEDPGLLPVHRDIVQFFDPERIVNPNEVVLA